MTSPYDPPGSPFPDEPSNQAVAHQLVNVPSILLMVVGAIGVVMGLVGLVGGGQQIPPELLNDPELAQYRDLIETLSGSGGVVLNIIPLALSVVVFLGGLKMRQLQSWGLAMGGSIVAIIPCIGSCCCIGIPVGIWALVVLNKPEVKNAFR